MQRASRCKGRAIECWTCSLDLANGSYSAFWFDSNGCLYPGSGPHLMAVIRPAGWLLIMSLLPQGVKPTLKAASQGLCGIRFAFGRCAGGVSRVLGCGASVLDGRGPNKLGCCQASSTRTLTIRGGFKKARGIGFQSQVSSIAMSLGVFGLNGLDCSFPRCPYVAIGLTG